MSQKSWAVTIIPLVIYLLGFGFSVVTGNDFSAQQADMLQGILYAFLGAGTIGAAKATIPKLTKQ